MTVLVIFTIKIFTTGNSTNLTYSNFWKQQPVNLLLYLIFFSMNKQTEQLWAPRLCPTLANSFLCNYEKEWLDYCPFHFKLIVCRRYVDDIFVLLSSMEHLQPFVDQMNKQHTCIKFTSETEQNNTFFSLTLI